MSKPDDPYNTELRPMMKLNELCEYFKANCVPADPDTIADFIVAGRYPFAVGLPADDKHNRRFQIFRVDAYRWLDEKLRRETIKI